MSKQKVAGTAAWVLFLLGGLAITGGGPVWCAAAQEEEILRVDPTAKGVEDGLSWPTAFRTLQAGIDAAPDGGEVWVAGGRPGAPLVYGEDRDRVWGSPASVNGSLLMKSGVGLYGGFEGYRGGAGRQEINRDERNRFLNPTVIDGSMARGGNPAYHVIVFGSSAGPATDAVLDGFTITGGNASGVAGDYHTWRGGGIYNWQSAPTISNCILYGNSAAVSGGAVANVANGTTGADAQFTNCLIYGNTARREADTEPNPIRGGGGVFNNGAVASFTCCTIAGNSIGSTSDYLGYTLYGAYSGGIYNWDTLPVVSSSIVKGNGGGDLQDDHPRPGAGLGVVAYTDVQYVYPVFSGAGGDGSWTCQTVATPSGIGVINVDPLFSNAAANIYTLQAASPAIGTAEPVISVHDDLRGTARPQGARADMGAYEYGGPVLAGSITINSGAKCATSAQVTLALTWDSLSGSAMSRMRFSDDGAHWTAWEPLAATRPHTLPGTDGYKTVRVQYRDAAGNVSDRFSDYILLDTIAPTGTILINDGAASTKNPVVTLALTWSDGTGGSGVVRMRFSDNGANWTAWEILKPTKTHTLPLPPGGYQTVRVQYRDGAGNISARYNDYIRLDMP